MRKLWEKIQTRLWGPLIAKIIRFPQCFSYFYLQQNPSLKQNFTESQYIKKDTGGNALIGVDVENPEPHLLNIPTIQHRLEEKSGWKPCLLTTGSIKSSVREVLQ